jgi:uncharacterized protein (TIGR02246 family)
MSDEEAIRSTLAAYCRTCDEGRFADFAALFAEDATFEVPPTTPAVGRAAIRGFMEAGYPPEVRGEHRLGESQIDVTGDEATVTSDFTFVGRDLRVTGNYHDHLRREPDGVWRFTRRLIEM